MSDNISKNKALILAAGLGTRLAPITNDVPKSLVTVNGKPIILKQIENLKLNGISEITIVSGYKAEVLEKAVHEIYPDIKIVESVDYKTTNNMYSAYLGLKTMFPTGVFKPFYMMNADVYYDSSVIAALEKDKRSNLIVVDIGRYIEESMKVTEQDGRIVTISKQIKPDEALGCSIDVYKFGADGSKAFFFICSDYIEKKKEKNLWSEVAINDILDKVKFQVCTLDGRWFEIDDHEDLAAAEQLFAE